ncbi:MAG: ABC transporter ATP-binding protein [Spirochaetales bacterium]|nr:ABC transporter ATP-binding protein [Spirochaetales bacterium]
MKNMHDNIVEINNLEVEIISPDGLLKAVRGLSLNVRRGETHGIVGESGCGKSVMVKSIMRLHDESKVAYSGNIFVNNKNIMDLKIRNMRKLRGKEMAMIFQNPMTSLSPIMTVGEQILEVLTAKSNISKDEAKKRSLEILEKVGITPGERRYKQYPFELSGGLLQRVMIAMSMVNNPELLIADEPTTALDVTIQAQILDLMKSVQKSTGVSIIFITHDLGVIAEMCDRVSIMYAGKIVESGNILDIFDHPAHPYTKALFESKPKGSDRAERMLTIPGAPPSLYDDIPGCSFALRCKYACPKCHSTSPKKIELDKEHWASCHFSREFFEKKELLHDE